MILQNTCKVIQERNRLNVLFVANDLRRHVTLLSTAELTVERNRIHVMNVRNVSHLRAPWLTIRIFTPVNTSARSAANAVIIPVASTDTGEFIPERNRSSVLFAENDLQ